MRKKIYNTKEEALADDSVGYIMLTHAHLTQCEKLPTILKYDNNYRIYYEFDFEEGNKYEIHIDQSIGTAQKGSAFELIVSADLLGKGYHVYRSMTMCAPFDLAAYKDGICKKVEVKSTFNKEKKLAKCNFALTVKEINYDVLALVDRTNKFIFYGAFFKEHEI